MPIFNNPEFIRLLRSKLRMRTLIALITAGVVIYGGVLTFTIFIEKSRSPFALIDIKRLLNNYFYVVTGIQLALISLYGVALAAQNISMEKERGTFDFQRLVAMGPWRLTIGKLFGAPAEAFTIALAGIPFAFAASVGGDLPFNVFVQAEFVIFVFGLVASAFGLMCSSVVEKTAHATALIMILGFPFYGALGSWSNASLWASSSPIFNMRSLASDPTGGATVNICGVDLPMLFGFILINGLLIGLCAMITARGIAEVELSYMTPRQGLIVFAILQVLLSVDILSQSSSRVVSGRDALMLFHVIDMFALLLLAFALTPGAELVRGRVFRGSKNQHWKIVFERTNILQDSPAIRAMLEVCAVYAVSSLIFTLLIRRGFASMETLSISQITYDAVMLTLMNASLGIAMTALLLYIQVYTERGCFKLGMGFLVLGYLVPILAIWMFTALDEKFKAAEYVVRVNPLAYIAGLDEVNRTNNELACPLCCLVLALTFCTLAALRIRFLLDFEDTTRRRLAGAL